MSEFIEEMQADPAKLDPLTPTCDEFPFEEIFARLDGEGIETRDYEMLGFALRQMMHFLLGSDLNRKGALAHIGRRTVALAWIVNPGYFEGSPSMSKLAQSVGLPAKTMHRLSAMASREFGVVNRGQAHGWNRGPQTQQASNGATLTQDETSTPQGGLDGAETSCSATGQASDAPGHEETESGT